MDDHWDKVREIFDRALALSTAERERYLATAAGDEWVRAEVARLLSITERRLAVLEEPRLLAGVPGDALPEPPGLAPGEVVGPYRIERLLGRGGMGAVYLAADPEHDRLVAIKVLPAALLRISEHERRLLGRLRHPHIATVYGSGTTGDGVPFVAMEYVDGVPLDRFCRERDLALEERLRLFEKICRAVDYTHRNQVVHRDLKPSNVLVTAGGEPKILDFGIAKLLPTDGDSVDPTQRAERFVSLAYASPEQLSGEWTGPASDIYTLGVLLCELLTGRRPHVATQAFELPIAILEGRLVRPSRLLETSDTADSTRRGSQRASADTDRALARALRRELDDVVLQALRREPEDRYPSAAQLADDIGRFLANQPVSAHRGSRAYRARKFVRRNLRPLLAAACACALLAALAGSAWHQSLRATRNRADAEIARLRAEQVRQSLEDAFAADGRTASIGVTGALRSAEIYDPETGRFEPTGAMILPRAQAGSILLADGRVLVYGGSTNEAWHITASAEIYDSNTATFLPASPMTQPRGRADPAHLLPDGSVVLAGGAAEGAYATATDVVELFRPEPPPGPGSWQRIGRLRLSRASAAQALLGGRRLLLVGGTHSCCNEEENGRRSRTAEIFDLATGRSDRLIELPVAVEDTWLVPLTDDLLLVLVWAEGSWNADRSLLFDGEEFSRLDSAAAQTQLESRRAELRAFTPPRRMFSRAWMTIDPARLEPQLHPIDHPAGTEFFSVLLADGRWLRVGTGVSTGSGNATDDELREILAASERHPDWGAHRLSAETRLHPGLVAKVLLRVELARRGNGDLERHDSGEDARAAAAADAAAGLEGSQFRQLAQRPLVDEDQHRYASYAAAPGPDLPELRADLLALLARPAGICGVLGLGPTQPFLLRATRVDTAEGVVEGTLHYYPEDDGTVLEFSGRVDGNVFAWWPTATVTKGRSEADYFHRARLLPDGKIEGTFIQRSGEKPSAGVVWLDPSEEATRICSQQRARAEQKRAARRPTRVVWATNAGGRLDAVASRAARDSDPEAAHERFALASQPSAPAITDVSVSGLWPEGDVDDARADVLFEDLCATWLEHRKGDSLRRSTAACDVVVLRQQRGGRWRARFGEDEIACREFERTLQYAWHTWSRRFGHLFEPELTCSARAAAAST